ncbi:MAG: choice-of-anchor tandem repeat GloVer-containing protein [Bacteroidota bacterium]
MNLFIWIKVAFLNASISLCILPLSAQQQLWGMSKHGGDASIGSIYRIHLGTHEQIEEFEFQSPTIGIHPNGGLEVGPDGKLYGTTREGGRNNAGVLFRVDTSGQNYEVVHHFDHSSGRIPVAELLLASDGLLYGLARQESLFSFDPLSDTYTVLASAGELGTWLKGGLVEASDGNLYGLANVGDEIFAWNLTQDSLSIAAEFVPFIGSAPSGTMIEASNGLLYGFFEEEGLQNFGGIFSFDPGTQQISTVHNFLATSFFPTYPAGQMVEANGVLYGTTFLGGANNDGCIFGLDLTSGVYTELLDFAGTGIERPNSGLIYHDGLLYGTCWVSPGFGGTGAVFSFDPTDTISPLTILHSFPTDQTEGIFPLGGLTLVGNKLFGTCSSSQNGHGTLYSLDILTNSFEKKLEFTEMHDGGFPVGRLVEGPDGLFYAMTEQGGAEQGGIIFSFDQISKEFNRRYSFSQISGIEPKGSLTFASDGMAYGLTYHRAKYDDGALFRFDPSNDSLTILHEFESNLDGENPSGYLVEGEGGTLYGLTGSGILFSVDRDSHQLNILHEFVDTSGLGPVPGIKFGSEGHLYGATYRGGMHQLGVLYQYDLQDSSYRTLHHFDGQDGRIPAGCPIEIEDGFLVGMTKAGGALGGGVLYSFDLHSNDFQSLHEFDPLTEGNNPNGELILAEHDQVFGVLSESFFGTQQGGVFRFDFSDSSFSMVHHFDETVGNGVFDHNFPESNFLVQGFSTSIEHLEQINRLQALKVFPNPTTSSLNISFEKIDDQEVVLYLTTLQGQVLMSKWITLPIGEIQESFDLEAYPAGLYLLGIEINGQLKTTKIIKR